MTENTQEKVTTEVPDLTKGDKINTYIRSTFLLGSFNFERMQSIGFAVSMIPAISVSTPRKKTRRRRSPVTWNSSTPSRGWHPPLSV